MKTHKQHIFKYAVLLIMLFGLMACSSNRKIGKVDNSLIIPPSLKVPANLSKKSKTSKKVVQQKSLKSQQRPRKASVISQTNQNYYIIVGTYPDHGEALDTFVRLSSIGLEGATMESRKTKSGRNLHMVRLGPYNKQEDIDKAKDSLTSDGLSQFKVVVN